MNTVLTGELSIVVLSGVKRYMSIRDIMTYLSTVSQDVLEVTLQKCFLQPIKVKAKVIR